MSELQEELQLLIQNAQLDGQNAQTAKANEICRKRAMGAIWYLARLNRRCGSVLLGLSVLEFTLTAGIYAICRPSLVLSALGVGGLMAGSILGTMGYIQRKESRAAQQTAHRILSDIEQGRPVKWCRKYSRICQNIGSGKISGLINVVVRYPMIEYKGYNLWRRLNQHARVG